MASWVSLNDLYVKTEGESTVNGTLKIVNSNTGTSNGLLVNQPGSTDSFYNVGDEIKSLRDSVSSSVIVHRQTGSSGNNITADNINGYTFVSWIGCASTGWVGSVYLEDVSLATTKIWFVYSAYSTGGNVAVWALYRKK